MKEEHKTILLLIEQYLTKNPEQRFGQALFNLDITQFDASCKGKEYSSLRDIYDDTDNEILKRIKLT